MRHASQILELALKTLDKDVFHRYYMCLHLRWMCEQELITFDELNATKLVVLNSIGGYTTLGQYLRYTKQMDGGISVRSPDFAEHQLKFYRKLIAQLRADDPMFLIIESAHHCGFSHEHIHHMIEDAGLPETSDETISNLLGKYADGIKE
jgi:hypothetical protein